MEYFFVPAGTAVELYATTLHYAPCSVDGKEFRCGVVLPRGTNEKLSAAPSDEDENKAMTLQTAIVNASSAVITLMVARRPVLYLRPFLVKRLKLEWCWAASKLWDIALV